MGLRLALLAALASVPLALVACGSESAAPPAATSETTRAAAASTFDAAATSICARLQRDAATLVGTAPSDEELADLVESWRAGFARIDELEPPAGRAAHVEAMLRHYRRTADAIELTIAAKDESVLAAIAGAVVEGQRGTRAARRAHLGACALFPEIEQPPADPEPTLEAARALLPEGAIVLRDDDAECSELGSCRIEFETAERGLRARTEAAIARLRAEGWKRIEQGRSPSVGGWVRAFRNDHSANYELISSELPPHCRVRADAPYCRDAIWVHRVEVPEVLTGG